MRLLLINNEFPPLGGGTATANWMLFRAWAGQSGVSIDLVTAAAGRVREVCDFAPNIRLIRLPVGIRDIHHAGTRELLVFTFRALREAGKLHRTQPYDAALAFHAVPAGIPLVPLKWFKGLPFWVRVGGADIPGFEKRYDRLYPVLKPILRRIWKAAAGVIVKSEGEREMLRKTEPGLDPVIIPNGVDTEMFAPDPNPSTYAGPLRVLCVARLIERKGQDQLIRAVAALAATGVQIELSLVGGGDARGQYEELANQLGLKREVRFLGEIARSDLPALYRNADLFAMTSLNEGMSNAMLEAMASGLPVLVTRTAGTDGVVLDGVNGWTLNWGDEPRLQTILREAVSRRNELQQMGVRAREHVSQFTWTAAARRYLELLTNTTTGIHLARRSELA